MGAGLSACFGYFFGCAAAEGGVVDYDADFVGFYWGEVVLEDVAVAEIAVYLGSG